MTRWQPGLELNRLLEALAEDIITATDEEVRLMHGRDIASTAREVRLFVKAAHTDKDGGLGESLSKAGTGLRPTKLCRRPSDQQRH